MNETPTAQPEKIRPLGKAQADMKAVERLIVLLQEAKEAAREESVLQALSRSQPIEELFERYHIQKEENVVVQLQQVKENLQREARTIRPENTVAVTPEATNDDERAAMMEVQARINELYKQNNEAEEIEKNLDQELAHLEAFESEKAGEQAAIEVTESLVKQYEKDIEDLTRKAESELHPGFFKKLFQGEVPEGAHEKDTEREQKIEERKNSIMRKKTGLSDRLQLAQIKEQRWRHRLQEIQGMLGEPAEEFSGTWPALVEKMKEALKRMKVRLDDEFTERQRAIAALEQERDGKGARTMGQAAAAVLHQPRSEKQEE